MTRASLATAKLAIRRPFELRLALFGHGWVDLPPHQWNRDRGELATVLDLGGRAVDVTLREVSTGLSLRISGIRSKRDVDAARAAVRRMLRLDEDLSEFWELCARHPRLTWVPRRGGGRLMRSAGIFEDLAKLLMTTNCSWAATRNMVGRLTALLGTAAQSGTRAFPAAHVCAAQTERFYRQEVRMGYRARSMRELSLAFAEGKLTEAHLTESGLPTEELRRRLLALPGFGPYAAGQALRLLGRYDDLALDSWCRARLAARSKGGRVPTDRSVWRRYAGFGRYRGLALWMDLTAHWHGESEDMGSPVLATQP